jgi:mono/diheme cytochrome c family protein
MRYAYLILVFGVVLIVSLFGFRGQTFTKPPIDVFPEWGFPGMKYQPKYKPQAESKFFADGRADRPLPPGVVASSYGPVGQPLRDDDHLYRGKTVTGAWATGFPQALTIDRTFMERGKERFMIYCQPCHGALGDGQGITKAYGMGATPTYHDDRLRKMAEGEIFNTITNGKNNMLSYADKLTPEDRWAVIAYVRALQRAQQGTAADVPAEHKAELDIK